MHRAATFRQLCRESRVLLGLMNLGAIQIHPQSFLVAAVAATLPRAFV